MSAWIILSKVRLSRALPVFFILSVGTSIILLTALGSVLPVALTNVLSMIAIIPFLPFISFLSRYGLTTGETFRAPTTLGYLLVVPVYTVTLYAIGWLIEKRRVNP